MLPKCTVKAVPEPEPFDRKTFNKPMRMASIISPYLLGCVEGAG
jgi:hypothetical protein